MEALGQCMILKRIPRAKSVSPVAPSVFISACRSEPLLILARSNIGMKISAKETSPSTIITLEPGQCWNLKVTPRLRTDAEIAPMVIARLLGAVPAGRYNKKKGRYKLMAKPDKAIQ